MKKVVFWLQELRAPFFTASVVPVVLGAVIAWARADQFHWGLFLLTLVAGVCLQAGTNVANDYFDHLSRNDEINREYVRPFTGGSRIIQKGLLTPAEVLRGALVCFGLGSLIGFYLAYASGPAVLWLGAIGLLSGFFYSAPPLQLVHRGLGEMLVGLNFGVLMTLGSYYVQTRTLAVEPIVASIPVAILITAVLYINGFQDARADAAVGKKQWVVRLGKKRAVTGYLVMLVLTYLSIIVAVALGVTPAFLLISLLTLPLALRAIRTARLYFDDHLRLTPANAATVMIHLLAGLLLSLGYVLEKVV